MAQDSSGKAAAGRNAGKDDRDARLAEALRANLRRRKAQSAARKDLPESGHGPEDGAASARNEISRKDKP
jgi:heme oxygenase